MTNETKSVFEVLSAIDCSEHVEKKNTGKVELSYLSWAWAWHICKEHYPTAEYTIYETPEGRPYWDDGKTAWVKTGVTIEHQEHIEYLPIMDHRNLSIPLENITSMDMNKAIQRSLTKALARHGLGLYIYAGEDLPWSEEEAAERAKAAKEAAAERAGKKGRGSGKKETPQPAVTAPAAPQEPRGNKPVPERGSDTWYQYVAAIAENKVGKSGQVHDWRQVFKATYAWTDEDIANLEEDVFNYRFETRTNA